MFVLNLIVRLDINAVLYLQPIELVEVSKNPLF